MNKKNVIFIKGAREHNLKNIDVTIPRDKLVVITGLSGSGKSSLAFDTIYAEGQRRYVESLNAYARQFLGLMEKPDVDYIEGLSPAISIEQKSTSRNPRSTVGTVTEIYDYFRLLFARIGTMHCPECGRVVERQTVQQIVDEILRWPENTKIQVLSPVIRGRKGEYKEALNQFRKDGFVRIRLDGIVYSLDEEINPDKNKKHNLELVVDRLVVKQDIRKRLTDSIELALNHGNGMVYIHKPETNEETLFSEKFACPHCHLSFDEPAPRNFSFNSPFGACPKCDGLGTLTQIDPNLIVPDQDLSIDRGAIKILNNRNEGYYYDMLVSLSQEYGFSLSVPWKTLSPKVKDIILYGLGSHKIKFKYRRENAYVEWYSQYEGIINNLLRRYKQTSSQHVRTWIEGFMNSVPCSECQGTRLKKESLAVRINGMNIYDLTVMSIKEVAAFFNNLKLTTQQEQIARQILKEVKQRLEFLINVGLDYLNLSRSAGTLSGGEAQRIRLATQIGSQLVGVLYILDEPSIGLHQRDNKKLIDTLKQLRDLGNTVVVVEHDRETIEAADYVIDLGPRAGRQGGEVVAAGPPEKISKNKSSLTGLYLSGVMKIPVPERRREGNGKFLVLSGATGNNLKNLQVSFPLGKFICVTGVSGSGKSTLVNETLYAALARHYYGSKKIPLPYKSIDGLSHIDKVIDLDQSPIGRTPRSNPATYTGLFTPLRDIFSQLPESKIRGYKPGRFSFNVKGGRCENCEGDGVKKIEMHFLPDVYVQCEECKGRRYNRETLEIKYKGKSIADVLEMTVNQALEFFANIPAVNRRLQTLFDVGLGYIHLGQAATTLSGGEAQRIKLATELSKIGTGNTLYILDEPTTGLHFEDINMLLSVLNRLVDKGNTVIVIEHNLDVIKTADWIIDIGPEGGAKGGRIIVEGSPEKVSRCAKSYTAKFLECELR
ncbi:MAG: excinuclease ABC subunit UvrA [Calditrichaceae bacterium]|nr:excinuclease ABC subunit UvrA [Calditrichaceae bacterium]MBN2707451.1 excinuclease ABC subunit UvrA [Calditrichaceae bacterium]RQV94018.1 MAG: excinuclease ABC subunit UvrA [Calditrichota bacterium]